MKSIFVVSIALLTSLSACDSAQQPQTPPADTANSATPAAPGTGTPAATAANAAESIKTRQTHYKEIGKSMKAINDELKKDAPDVAVIQAAAKTINGFAPQIQGWFPDGSGAEAGIKTEAKAEIWSKPEEFKQASQKFVTEAARFNTIAASGDLAQIRDGVKALGGSCKGCHEPFRVDD